MDDKDKLMKEIREQISATKSDIGGVCSSEISDATNRVALSNLYIALSNLTK